MEWINISTNSEIIRIPADDIVFVKGGGNYSDIYLCNDKEESLPIQLHNVMDKLSMVENSMFYRVGKSLIVNKSYIFKVNPGLQKLLLSSSKLTKDIQIKASREALKTLKEQLDKDGGEHE